jgi:hypothetical protein
MLHQFPRLAALIPQHDKQPHTEPQPFFDLGVLKAAQVPYS